MWLWKSFQLLHLKVLLGQCKHLYKTFQNSQAELKEGIRSRRNHNQLNTCVEDDVAWAEFSRMSLERLGVVRAKLSQTGRKAIANKIRNLLMSVIESGC